MKVLVANGNIDCMNCLVAIEIIGGPKSKDYIAIKIGNPYKDYQVYKPLYQDIIEIDLKSISDITKHINDHKDIVIDLYSDVFRDAIDTKFSNDLLINIDRIVIPVLDGKSNAMNAIRSYFRYKYMAPEKRIIFILCHAIQFHMIPQFDIFFKLADMNIEDYEYVQIHQTELFKDVEKLNTTVAEMASRKNLDKEALKAKEEGKHDLYEDLISKDLISKACNLLLNENIMPAHNYITG